MLASHPEPRSDNELLREILETLKDILKLQREANQQATKGALTPPQVK